MPPTEPVPFDRKAIVGAALLAGGANVIMQLARPGVGYGVIESPVESGQLHRHPIKRARTTFSYLAVAIMGTPQEKAAFRKAVNKAHAQVRSGPASPVPYNAFDRELQLWVAACLYRGLEDTYRSFIGPIDPAERERLYRSAATLGTTLQVRPEDWPPDRAAFEEYWQRELKKIAIDEPVRRYLGDLADLRFLPGPVSLLFGPANRFVTTGFLPPEFREQMRLPWSDRDQRRFDRLVAALRAFVRIQPPVLRRFPFDLLLWDVRRRMRTGRPLV
ncbi:oxygenase MpaB family protein [Actinomadura miaoliensis]|uniref:Oxygenase MpaB family protein n=1 Tax=Actinomadura miaoliensis TaxID=430685 RepID=A0ABP7VDG9_9ACTN